MGCLANEQAEMARQIKKLLDETVLTDGLKISFLSLATGLQNQFRFCLVADSDTKRGFKVAKVLRESLSVDVMLGRLDAFLPKDSCQVLCANENWPALSAPDPNRECVWPELDNKIVHANKPEGTFKVKPGQREIDGLDLLHENCPQKETAMVLLDDINAVIECACGFREVLVMGPNSRNAIAKFVVNAKPNSLLLYVNKNVLPRYIKLIQFY